MLQWNNFFVSVLLSFLVFIQLLIFHVLVHFSNVGSLVLVGGDPGVGKSTLLLQVLNLFFSDLCSEHVYDNMNLPFSFWTEDCSINIRRKWYGGFCSSHICIRWRGQCSYVGSKCTLHFISFGKWKLFVCNGLCKMNVGLLQGQPNILLMEIFENELCFFVMWTIFIDEILFPLLVLNTLKFWQWQFIFCESYFKCF